VFVVGYWYFAISVGLGASACQRFDTLLQNWVRWRFLIIGFKSLLYRFGRRNIFYSGLSVHSGW
jgi:hypothetical protein